MLESITRRISAPVRRLRVVFEHIEALLDSVESRPSGTTPLTEPTQYLSNRLADHLSSRPHDLWTIFKSSVDKDVLLIKWEDEANPQELCLDLLKSLHEAVHGIGQCQAQVEAYKEALRHMTHGYDVVGHHRLLIVCRIFEGVDAVANASRELEERLGQCVVRAGKVLTALDEPLVRAVVHSMEESSSSSFSPSSSSSSLQ